MTASRTESAEIKSFIDNNENTMKEFVSCSIGMGILTLMNHQFPKEEKANLDDSCRVCISDLKKT